MAGGTADENTSKMEMIYKETEKKKTVLKM